MASELLEFISPSWIKPLVEKLLKIRADREKEITTIGDTFGDPLELSKYYVEPHCQHANPASEDEDDPISIVKSPVSITINNFLSGDFATRGDGRSQMFILSDAGMGKTSLLVMLKLAHIASFWPKGYECSLLKLSASSIDEIEAIPNKSKTVLLLDALDEDPKAWGNFKERVLKILTASKNFRRVIISCRTQFFPEDEIDPFNRIGRIKISGFVCPMMYLSLFDMRQVLEYLEKRFSHDEELTRKRKLATEIISKMGSLKFRPLLLAHIDGFIESENINWNEFNIYRTLVFTWLMREEVKLYEQGKDITQKDLLNACLTVSWEMQSQAERTLSSEKLEKLLDKYPEISNLEIIDVGGRSLLNKNCSGEFRFSHYSIQEFVVSYGIINKLYSKSQKDPRIKCTSKMIDFIFSSENKNLSINLLDFDEAQFKGRTLKDYSFSGTSLIRANFSNCVLERIDFSGCNLLESNFTGAVLRNVDFTNADMRDSRFSGVNLTSTKISGANFGGSDLSASNLSRIKSIGVNFKNADLSNANLALAKFKKSNFNGADLTSASLQNCEIRGSLYKGIKLHHSNTNGLICSKQLTSIIEYQRRESVEDIDTMADIFSRTKPL